MLMGFGVKGKSFLCSDVRSVLKRQNCHLGRVPMCVIDREGVLAGQQLMYLAPK